MPLVSLLVNFIFSLLNLHLAPYTGTLSIVTEDEASYFADGKPKLSAVSVSVISFDGSLNRRFTTGDNGLVVLKDIPEAFYTIRASKTGTRLWFT